MSEMSESPARVSCLLIPGAVQIAPALSCYIMRIHRASSFFFLRCILLHFPEPDQSSFFCCTFLVISALSCDSGRLFFCVHFRTVSRSSCLIFYVGILWHFLVVNRPFLCAIFCKFSPLPRRFALPDRLLPRMPYIPDHTAFHGFLTASGPDKTDHRPHHPPPEGGQGQQAPGSGQRLYRQNDGFDRFYTAKHSGFLRFFYHIWQNTGEIQRLILKIRQRDDQSL